MNIYIYNYIINNKINDFDSIRLFGLHTLNNIKDYIFKIDNIKFNYIFIKSAFWFHQFIKCKTLKEIFFNAKLPKNYGIRKVTQTIQSHICITPSKNICKFGETTRSGILTQNAYDILLKYKIPPPNMPIANNTIIINNITMSGKQELKHMILTKQKQNK